MISESSDFASSGICEDFLFCSEYLVYPPDFSGLAFILDAFRKFSHHFNRNCIQKPKCSQN
jgi:hypothetical protein